MLDAGRIPLDVGVDEEPLMEMLNPLKKSLPLNFATCTQPHTHMYVVMCSH